MKAVISFSVYGSDPKYTMGMLKNIELANYIYPGWLVYVYHSNIPSEILEQYKKYPYVTTFDMSGSDIPGMFWRFLVESDIFISRDADSRLSQREKSAVDEWIFSGKSLHVMRDHPAHNVIVVPGGMFGINRLSGGVNIDMKQTVNKWLSSVSNSTAYGVDQIFLRGIYAFYYERGDVMIHDSIGSFGDKSVPFPTKLDKNYHFVGEVFDEFDNIREDHVQDWIREKHKER
jgi:hypothetical protein